MSSLIVYVTRPTAYEIYMGSDRSLRLWLVRPDYSHESFASGLKNDASDGELFSDQGWLPQTGWQRAKPLLRQAPALRSAVWREVLLSVMPKGMDPADGLAWCDAMRPAAPGESRARNGQVENWRALFDNKEWEGRCAVSHKRFLLEVDLLASTAIRIAPRVHLRRMHDGHLAGEPDWIETDQIEPEMATEYWHAKAGPNSIPF